MKIISPHVFHHWCLFSLSILISLPLGQPLGFTFQRFLFLNFLLGLSFSISFPNVFTKGDKRKKSEIYKRGYEGDQTKCRVTRLVVLVDTNKLRVDERPHHRLQHALIEIPSTRQESKHGPFDSLWAYFGKH